MVPDLPPWRYEPKGRYDEHLFESQVLKKNGLGDPHERPLLVYVPPATTPTPAAAIPAST